LFNKPYQEGTSKSIKCIPTPSGGARLTTFSILLRIRGRERHFLNLTYASQNQ